MHSAYRATIVTADAFLTLLGEHHAGIFFSAFQREARRIASSAVREDVHERGNFRRPKRQCARQSV
jgi:hypothetical protein